MIVLVDGVSFINKGAELMLAAITEKMQEESIDVATAPHIGSFRDRARYGLLQLFDVQSIGRLGPVVQRVVRPNYRKLFGMVTLSDCEGLLDASGFFLGDQWRVGSGKRKLQRFRNFRRSHKPVILMPQAFGPFEANSPMTAFAREVLFFASLVYARDECSLSHLRILVPDHPGLRLAPDFTALVAGLEPNGLQLGSAPAAVIPNTQMVVRGQVDEQTYVGFLAEVVRLLRSTGLDPFLLLHESSLDKALANKVCARVTDISVVEEPDARVVKGIIRRCVLTVGSRFHGLVSALSEGIPSIATGWSHKYQSLLSTFGCPECLIDPRSDVDRLPALVAELVSEREVRHRSLLQHAIGTREQICAMWSEIGKVLVGSAAW